MNQNVKVTIGLCVKNSEATIRRAVVSILDQDFSRKLLELIVVDGCSRDKTLSVIEDFTRGTSVRTKIFSENKGLGYARQLVVDKALGEYIVWVDGDMLLTRDFIRKQVEFMDQNPDVGIAKGKYGLCANFVGGSIVATLEDVEFLLSTKREGETRSKSLGTSGCIYRVKAVRQVGGFDPYVRGVGEDMDAENRIREAGWMLYVTSATFYEIRRQSWRSLWNEYFWHGMGGRRLVRKGGSIFDLYKMVPPIALAIELSRIPTAYKLTGRKAVLFLPFHYAFKRMAWFFGFLKGD
jgi:glycosyltransferase involved in cell wall biosynthesis